MPKACAIRPLASLRLRTASASWSSIISRCVVSSPICRCCTRCVAFAIDDSQVVDLHCRKVLAELTQPPGAHIRIASPGWGDEALAKAQAAAQAAIAAAAEAVL